MAVARIIRLSLLALVPLFAASAFGGSLDAIRKDIRSGQHQRALSEVTRLLRSDPGHEEAILLQATAQHRLGRRHQAAQTLEKLIESNPSLSAAYNNLAVIYAEQGDLEKARTTLEKGIRADKVYSTLHGNLTEIYGKMAQDAYGKALDLKSAKKAPQLASLWELGSQSKAPTMVVAKAEPPKPSPQKPVAKRPDPVSPPKPVQQPEPELIASIPKPKPAAEPEVEKAKPISITPAEPETTPAVAKPPRASGDRGRTIGPIRRLLGWARAWSSKDPEGYIAFYSRNYKPGGMSRTAWKEQRRSRISRPEWIKVDVNEFRAKPLSDERVEIEFRQIYQSDRFNSKVRKKVEMINEGDGWVIANERVTARE